MKKYNIEGDIDFYSELYKSLDVEENEHKTEEDSKLCLITNKPLTDNYYEMKCGHKFNYLPLYLDIKNHKQKYNGMETTSGQLKKDEIRCPYCRKKQTGILPYYEELGLAKINGVNTYNPEPNSTHVKITPVKQCQFLQLNPNFDKNGNNIVEVDDFNEGNCKFLKCFSYGGKINYTCFEGQYKKGNLVIEYSMPTDIDTNCYCFSHKKFLTKKYKDEIVNKAKEEYNAAKLKEKEDLKKTKEEAKQKEKEEKQKIKEELKKQVANSKKNIKTTNDKSDENVVIGIVDISTNNEKKENICLEVLKTGPKKGEHCSCNIFAENVCKRHYNLKNKKNNQ